MTKVTLLQQSGRISHPLYQVPHTHVLEQEAECECRNGLLYQGANASCTVHYSGIQQKIVDMIRRDVTLYWI